MSAILPFANNLPKELEMPYLSPNLQELQGYASKANSLFEQNVNQIKNDYSAVINAPVTNTENQEAKQKYIKIFQDGVKKLSQSDTTMPQHVLQAENLLSPFWSDEDMLHDMAITKDATSKIQQAQADANSKEEKIRNSYNPWSAARQKYVLEDLKNARRGDGSIANVERADYIPISDYQAYVDEQDKSSGFKGISKQRINGPELITEVNGVGAMPQLKTRYDAMLGSKFQGQFSQQGYVMHRQELDQLAQQHPEIPRSQIAQQLAANKYNDIKSYYDRKLENFGHNVWTTFQMPIAALYELKQKQGGKLTDEQQRNLNNLEVGYKKEDGTYVPGQQQYLEQLSQLSTEREQFMNANPNEKINDIVKNPENYYSKLVRQETIDKLAATQASAYSYSIGVNEVWDKVANHREKETELKLKDAEVRLKGAELSETRQRDLWHHQDTQAGIAEKYYEAGIIIDPKTGEQRKVDPTTGATVSSTQLTGQQVTDQQNINFSNVLNSQKAALLTVASDAGYGRNGTANRLADIKDKDGKQLISDNDVLQFKTAMGRLYNAENYTDAKFTMKPQEIEAFHRVRKTLENYLGHPVPNTYDAVNRAKNEYLTNEYKRRSTDLKIPMIENDPYAQAYTQTKIEEDALNGYIGKVQEEKTALKHLTLSDRNEHKILLNDAGTAVAGVADVAQISPIIEATDSRTGERKIITPQEYAAAYLGGNMEHPTENTIKLNSRVYNVDKVNGRPNQQTHYDQFGNAVGAPGGEYESMKAIHNLMDRYGSYSQRNQLNRTLQNKVASYMPSVRDHTGKTGMDISYGFGNAKNPGNGEKIIAEAINPANHTNIRFQGESEDMSIEDQRKLQVMAGSYESTRKNLGQPIYSTVSATGQDVVRIPVDWLDAKGNTISKVVEIPLSPHVTGEVLSGIPKSSGLYTYGRLLKGEIIQNDSNDEHMGFKSVVVPDNADHPTSVTVKCQHLEVQKDGSEVWVSDAPINIPMGGNGWNPDMIMNAVSQRRNKDISALASQRVIHNTQNLK